MFDTAYPTRFVPAWAQWSSAAAEQPWTVGVEDELVLMDPRGWSPANRADELVAALPGHASTETHACVVELKTAPHQSVAEMAVELATLRGCSTAISATRSEEHTSELQSPCN